MGIYRSHVLGGFGIDQCLLGGWYRTLDTSVGLSIGFDIYIRTSAVNGEIYELMRETWV